MMTHYSIITTDIAEAARVVAEGRVVAVPTGTSYGLAADALQGFALQRVRNLKQRPHDKTFTVCMTESLWDAYLALTSQEEQVLAAFVGQALTLLVKPKPALAHLAQNGRVGLRVIDHSGMKELSEMCGVPLTATSANRAGEDPCDSPACVQQAFPGRIDESTYDLSLGAIIDGGTLSPALPTTIASLEDDKVIIHRAGGLTSRAIEQAL